MKNHKISVIISVYNNSSHLLKCLVSLNSQSFLPDEVILTDDGSQENIKQIVMSNPVSFRFKLIFCQQADIGFRLSRCKNNGIRQASNEIIVFFDQDIITTKNYLKVIADNIKPNIYLVSLPVRTSLNQFNNLSLDIVSSFNYNSIITQQQHAKLSKQYFKEQLYYLLHKLGLRKRGVKIRGGCFAIYKTNLVKINGFDEKFISWGNEDDDLGKRLGNIGINGKYPFKHEYSIHLYHPENHDGTRKNEAYYNQNREKYSSGYYYCEYGINNSIDSDEIRTEILKD